MSKNWKGWDTAALEALQARGITPAIQNRLDHAEACLKPALVPDKVERLVVGIDPGTHTGMAVKDGGVFKAVKTVSIIEAIEAVKALHKVNEGLLVKIEDARLRTFFGNTGKEKQQGAGSIKRDCSIWEAEMKRCNIKHLFVHPRSVKATTPAAFKALTGWAARTSIHAREAAWIILND